MMSIQCDLSVGAASPDGGVSGGARPQNRIGNEKPSTKFGASGVIPTPSDTSLNVFRLNAQEVPSSSRATDCLAPGT